MEFRAFFNETDVSADDCETLVREAVEKAPGLTLVETPHTIASDYGAVENITVDFVVDVDESTDSRSPKGQLNETLMGDNPCDGLTPKN
jgi:hypothetical protein